MWAGVVLRLEGVTTARAFRAYRQDAPTPFCTAFPRFQPSTHPMIVILQSSATVSHVALQASYIPRSVTDVRHSDAHRVQRAARRHEHAAFQSGRGSL